MVKAGIAVGFDNDWYGEEVGALVLLKDGLYNPDSEISIKNEIISRCKEKLPFYKTPKTSRFYRYNSCNINRQIPAKQSQTSLYRIQTNPIQRLNPLGS